MNLDKVIIKNFKNYTGEHEFNLNKRITIILGKNGFGKSSFFDAIEWCMTGRLNRFNRKEFNPKDVLNYEDYGMEKECKVEIYFNGNKLKRKFRYQDGRLGNIKVSLTTENGNFVTGQSKIDEFLKNAYFRSFEESSEIFGNLIKHSHLLSQDQVSDFISKDNPKERFKSLAEIMGLKNVLYTIENYNQIKKEANIKIEYFSKQRDNYKLLIKERRNDLTRVNFKEISSALKELKLNKRFKDCREELEERKQRIEKRNFEKQKEKELLNDYVKKGYNNLEEVSKEIDIINKNKITIERKINKARLLEDDVGNLINSLKSQADKFEEINKLNEEIKKKKVLLKKNRSNKLSVDEVKETLSEKNHQLKKIDFAISYQKNYKEIISFRENYLFEKDRLENKSEFLARRSKKIDLLSNNIDAKISEYDTGVAMKLLDHIKGIYSVIEEEEELKEVGRCPVCSAEHGNRLSYLVSKNVHEYKEIVNHDASLAEKLLSMKKRMAARREEALLQKESTDNELMNLNRKNENYYKVLDKIKSSKLFDSEYLKLRKNELQKIQEEIESAVSYLDEVLSIKSDIDEFEKKLNVIKKVVGTTSPTFNYETRKMRLKRLEQRIQKYISKNESRINELNELYTRMYKEYSIVKSSTSLTAFEEQIKMIDQLFNESKKKLILIDRLLDYNNIHNLNKNIGQDIKKYYKEKKENQIKIQELQKICNSIELFIDEVQNDLGDETSSFLNASNSLIQKYYRYLNPMANNMGVKFESEEGKLNIFIPIKDENKKQILYNVKHTLSSGQLNVLAISIFLAVNESQKVSKLNFVGIDDPIQNMDNVNRYSMCDVLSQIKKQLIISTHDEDFVKLFVKKNQHIKNEIQLFLLESPLLEKNRVKSIKL
ncbi:AAA family ATPase [Salinicoccus roseus]|uniref:AAA family ATPase n=1 Tax=Salinicoccus roseus TaxID=45670 RepID=UPI002300E0DC|nr:SMC family ATPase [Salinicoccus roseus]